MKHLLAIVAFTVTLAACGPLPVCTPADTRCTGTGRRRRAPMASGTWPRTVPL